MVLWFPYAQYVMYAHMNVQIHTYTYQTHQQRVKTIIVKEEKRKCHQRMM